MEFGGGLDLATVALVAPAVNAVVRVHRPSSLELDLSQLFCMASCGIDALLRVHVRVRAAGCVVVVTHPRPAIRRVLTVTGALDILTSGSAPADGAAAPGRRHWPVLNRDSGPPRGPGPLPWLLDVKDRHGVPGGWPSAGAERRPEHN